MPLSPAASPQFCAWISWLWWAISAILKFLELRFSENHNKMHLPCAPRRPLANCSHSFPLNSAGSHSVFISSSEIPSCHLSFHAVDKGPRLGGWGDSGLARLSSAFYQMSLLREITVLFLMLPGKWQGTPLAPWNIVWHLVCWFLKFIFPCLFHVSYYLPSATLEKNLYTGQWKWVNVLFSPTFHYCFRRGSRFLFAVISSESLLLLSSRMEDIFGFMWPFAYFSKASLFKSSMCKQTATAVHLVSSWIGFTLAFSCLSSSINVSGRWLFQTFPISVLALHFGMRNSLVPKNHRAENQTYKNMFRIM